MNKIYSGFHQLPRGNASTMVQEGCVVLEDGALRGLYGEDVLDALMLENINLRCTIGVSAGAMSGLNYVSDQTGKPIRMNLKYRHDKRYVGRKALRNGEGLVGFVLAFHQADQEYLFNKKRFSQFDRRFIAVATNCETAEPAYLEKDHCRDISQAVQASVSMPFISKMVWMEGYPYLDGGCSDKIPFDWALWEGYKKIIVVRTRPLSYRKKMDSITRKLPLEKMIYKPYPKFIKALEEMDASYNRQCKALEILQEQKCIHVVAPSQPVIVGRLGPDLEKLGSLYWMGYYDTRRQIQDICRYLRQDGSIRILHEKDLYSIGKMLSISLLFYRLQLITSFLIRGVFTALIIKLPDHFSIYTIYYIPWILQCADPWLYHVYADPATDVSLFDEK